MDALRVDAEQERLLIVIEERVAAYEVVAVKAARARVRYEGLKAKAVLAAMAGDESSRGPSVSRAEYVADAEPYIATLKLEYLTKAAERDAADKVISSVKEQLATLRTMAVGKRSPV